jgi:hypothetical protein
METTTEQIETMKEFAIAISKVDGVLEACVNDWGRYGNFDVHYSFNPKDKNLKLRKMNNEARKLLKEIAPGAHIRTIFTPKRMYDSSYGTYYFTKYERSYVTIDVDFQYYSVETNSFN